MEKKFGHYEVIDVIGSGGMGVIYKAYDSLLDRYVAIKVLPENLTVDRGLVERFKREAKASAKLNHPHIVSIYHLGEEKDKLYFVMEYIEGDNLALIVNKKQRFLVRDAINAIISCAKALQYAFENGIIHRDIKPSNILVTKDGTIKIADFGLAKNINIDSSLTSSGSLLGTPQYMSPEQAKGEKADFRSDIYSLGATFFHLIVGSPPFDADSFYGLVMKHSSETLPPPDPIKTPIPDEVYRIIKKMMAKKPENRYQSYNELITDLNNIMDVSASLKKTVLVKSPLFKKKVKSIAIFFSSAILIIIVGISLSLLNKKESIKISTVVSKDTKGIQETFSPSPSISEQLDTTDIKEKVMENQSTASLPIPSREDLFVLNKNYQFDNIISKLQPLIATEKDEKQIEFLKMEINKFNRLKTLKELLTANMNSKTPLFIPTLLRSDTKIKLLYADSERLKLLRNEEIVERDWSIIRPEIFYHCADNWLAKESLEVQMGLLAFLAEYADELPLRIGTPIELFKNHLKLLKSIVGDKINTDIEKEINFYRNEIVKAQPKSIFLKNR